MKRKVIKTSDGSSTIFLEDWNESYHSRHGAINEAYHVFINNGLKKFKKDQINILEIGFGTGLNAFITLLEAEKLDLKVHYEGVEAYPIAETELKQLNYIQEFKTEEKGHYFKLMHFTKWDEVHKISEFFDLKKRKQFFSEISDINVFNLIYFDAFGARVQPELWTQDVFFKMYMALKPGGILVTYAAKGSVRRAMQSVGFIVERLPGPPGKREMLRALKEV